MRSKVAKISLSVLLSMPFAVAEARQMAMIEGGGGVGERVESSGSGGEGFGQKVEVVKQAVLAFFGRKNQPASAFKPTETQNTAGAATRNSAPAEIQSGVSRDQATHAPAASTSPSSSSAPTAVQPMVQVDVAAQKISPSTTSTPEQVTGPVGSVARLNINKEAKIHAQDYFLDGKAKKLFNKKVMTPQPVPPTWTAAQTKKLLAYKSPKVAPVPMGKFPNLTMSLTSVRSTMEKHKYTLREDGQFTLLPFKPLTPDEFRFLSALYVLKEDRRCTVAMPLLHTLAQRREWKAEANFYLSQCSKELNLISDYYEQARHVIDAKDEDYTPKLLRQLTASVPYEYTETIGSALTKYMTEKGTKEIEEQEFYNIAFLITQYAAALERHKTVLEWGSKIPPFHEKYPETQFVTSLAQYHINQRAEALRTLQNVLSSLQERKARPEFQALVALNLGRMLFQDREFKEARNKLLLVAKDHPLWLQSLTEMGWAQLMAEDFEGAVGNMYSVHSPFFASVYKPESFVIQTIGYLNLCQYGDAYRSLSILEKDYRPALEKIDRFTKNSKRSAYYETVRKFLLLQANKKVAPKASEQWKTDVDGLPMPIVREIARHRDFTNLQNALNRQIDERSLYDAIPGDVSKAVREWEAKIAKSKLRIDQIRRGIAAVKGREDAATRTQLEYGLKVATQQMDLELFKLEIHKVAEAGLKLYRTSVIDGADQRRAKLKTDLERILANRLLRLKTELARMLDNNELLRYEVFSGSGENIRFQVAGGDKVNRIPASVLPQQKSLRWDFDGEYWEDEIGHYRSGIKSNCPDAKVRERASN